MVSCFDHQRGDLAKISSRCVLLFSIGLLLLAGLSFHPSLAVAWELPTPAKQDETEPAPLPGHRFVIEVKNSIDGNLQPALVILPQSLPKISEPIPLVVSLHSWSGDWTQANLDLEQATVDEGWIYLFPNFRGMNDDPKACGSELAQRDILDAVDWCRVHLPVDSQRIYLTGTSGGGHMTMLMAGRYPDYWAAASAWVGISDLAAWQRLHQERGTRYGRQMIDVCGGKPGDSREVDQQYMRRSPRTYLSAADDIPLDLAAGIHDGHRGSVPVSHTLHAFNAVIADPSRQVPQALIEAICEPPSPEMFSRLRYWFEPFHDESWGRKIFYRRQEGFCRVSIFEGGHERVTPAIIEWFRGRTRLAP